MFFETTIMGKTADLAMIQKTIIDTLHKESKSQRVITEGVAVYRVLYQSILNAKLTGRKNLGRKRCTSNSDDRKLENTVNQSWFKHSGASQGVDWSWSQCIKSHHAQTSSGKGLPSHFWTRDNVRSILPGLWRKNWIWAAMSSAGVGPLCFLKSTVNAAIYQDFLEHFMLSSADKLYRDADFIFQQDLAPAHTAKGTKSWLNDHGVTVLDWPANSPDLNPIENLWSIVKRKMRDTRPNNADELKATVKETWASIPPQQCHQTDHLHATPNWGSN